MDIRAVLCFYGNICMHCLQPVILGCFLQLKGFSLLGFDGYLLHLFHCMAGASTLVVKYAQSYLDPLCQLYERLSYCLLIAVTWQIEPLLVFRLVIIILSNSLNCLHCFGVRYFIDITIQSCSSTLSGTCQNLKRAI